jgi:hypothetical protein
MKARPRQPRQPLKRRDVRDLVAEAQPRQPRQPLKRRDVRDEERFAAILKRFVVKLEDFLPAKEGFCAKMGASTL